MTFNEAISDLLINNNVLSMSNMKQHLNVSCLEHCLSVAYISYSICQALGWDANAAARGGLLHDLFLYNQYEKGRNMRTHLIMHSKIALENAENISSLSDIEKDIIVKHMWPLTLKMPKYKESFVVNFVDKACAIYEAIYSLIALNKTHPLYN